MSISPSPNRGILIRVARQLAPLLPDIVFVGGQVAELLVTDPAATRIRPTHDVDVVVSALGKVEYRAVEDQLYRLGLRNDMSENAPLCRWQTKEGYQLDVMSSDEATLGFSNRWYSAVLRRAVPYRLEADLEIRIPTAPVFVATKWEAFLNRGEGDYYGSHDLEDIIAVVAGRPELAAESLEEDEDLRAWLGERARDFLDHPDSSYALRGALPDSSQIPELLSDVRARFQALVEGEGRG